PNEIWCYGDKAQKIMEAQIKLREKLKPYIAKLYAEASKNGSPLMRAMFYEFPDDAECWNIRDQYMFGGDYLVAPVLHAGETKREVYLPEGKWTEINSGKSFEGGKRVTVDAPIEWIPVFKRG
ncbi:MAG TPA: family 31 glucosidase, partial [Treponema sp.]|nr:family 31 glucosidase [Treponema sp.]